MIRDVGARSRTAREPKHCHVCQAFVVQSGHRYRIDTFAADGSIYDWVNCQGCQAMSRDVYEWWDCPEDGITVAEFEEWVSEHSDDPQSVAFHARLAEAAVMRQGFEVSA